MKFVYLILTGWIIWGALAFGWKVHDFETHELKTYEVIETVERKGEIYAIYQAKNKVESYRLSPEEIYMQKRGIFSSVNIRTTNARNAMLEGFGFVFLLFSLLFLIAGTCLIPEFMRIRNGS